MNQSSWIRGSYRLWRGAVATVLCFGTVGVTIGLVGVEPAWAAAQPAITAVSPKFGISTGGTSVTITGTNLTSATAVYFGLNANSTEDKATITSDTSTKIVATSPAAPTSCSSYPCQIDIHVTTAGGTSNTVTADEFTYELLPVVTNVVGNSSATEGGGTVIVEGSNFTSATAVRFAGVAATSFSISSATQIAAVVPALPSSDTAGKFYNVTVSNGAGTSATGTGSQWYWFGSGDCSFGGTGVNNGGGPPGSSAYMLNVNPSIGSTTGTVSTSSTTLTDPNANFIGGAPPTGDVGLGIVVENASGSGNPLITTIAAVNSSTSVTMAAAAKVSISGASYAYGEYATTSCTNLSGLSLTSPFIESLSDPEAAVVTGTGTGGDGGNESWLGWSGANNYSTDMGSTYTTPGSGFVYPPTGSGTSGGCPESAGLCQLASEEGSPPYYGTDPQAVCPPTQAEANAGFETCSVGALTANQNNNSYISASLDVQYTNAPTPAQPTVSFTPNTGLAAGMTVNVDACSSCDWWGSASSGAPGAIAGVGTTGVATEIPAPAVWVGTSRSSAVQATTSNLVITPSTYNCGSTGGASLTSPGPTASCTLGQGAISGTFVMPSGTGCTSSCNVYVDEANTTLVPGEYTADGGSGSYNLGLSYNLENAVESNTGVSFGSGPPSVISASPSSGPAGGGTTVTISGTNFTGATAVDFGSTAATGFTVNSATSITATAPPGTGTVDITVTTPLGTSATSSFDQYAYVSIPSVSGVSPSAGPTAGGTSVTISGSSFSGATAINFGGTAASSFTINSDTSITAVSPAEAAGTVHITVTGPSGTSATSSADQFTFTAAPTVTSVSPSSGPTSGGTTVTIGGTNLSGATAVSFGGTAASSFSVVNGSTISAVSPAEAGGTVDVTVTTAGGTSATSSADQFTYAGTVPTVSAVSPSSGPTTGGTTVTVTGAGFTGATAVSFGGSAAASFTVNSDTSITAVTPAESADTVDVSVTTAGGTSAANPPGDQFTFVTPPTISSISPIQGPTAGGTSVVITGTNLTAATAVHFGADAAASFTVNSATQITAVTPAESAGAVAVTATTAGGTATSPTNFTFVAAPTVSAVSPSSGPTTGGTTVTVTGAGFTGATAVSFGGSAAASFTVNSDTQITATSPAESADTVDVSVTTAGGTSAANPPGDQFTFVTPPTISSISPIQGPTAGGTSVVITGTNLTAATAVHFGADAAASFTVNSATQITAVTPAESAGAVAVTATTAGGTATSPTNFTFVAAPTVSAVSPSSGPTTGGTTVTVTGAGFTGATAVSFGGSAAASFTVNSDTSITAVTPAESAGTVDVSVTTAGGTSAANPPGDQFTFVTPPTISSISPIQGPTAGGTSVVITGTNLTAATAVHFGADAAASFTVNSATQITAVTPAESAGAVAVTATTAGGTATSPTNFTFVAAPTVSAVSPSSGPTTGGTTVTVTGAGFTGATAVSFGGSAAASFTVNSDTQITATSPAESAGTVDVSVTTAGGTSAANPPGDQFTFVTPPTISSISPSSGPTTGGTTVTVTGAGFTGATAVSFGGTAAASFTVNSDTQVTATSPAEAAGTVDITVTTPVGTSTSTSADQFTFVTTPIVSSVSPGSGPTTGGTSVTITGSSFTGATTVDFGGTAAASFTVNSDTQITATSPGEPAGTVDVTVSTASGTSATSMADQFTFVTPPTITSISPTQGPTAGGTSVTITGSSFTGATTVDFGGTAAASFTVNSDTQVTATSPAEPAGTVDITVTTADGTSALVSGDQFTFVAPPAVTSISPTSGPTSGGTSVTITGSNFDGATAVDFGPVPSTGVTVNSDSSITAQSPPHAPATVAVTVTTPFGKSATSNGDEYTYVGPYVSKVSPTAISTGGGNTITVTGLNFTGATAVDVGGNAAGSVHVVSAKELTAVAPAGTAGPADVTVTTPVGTSPDVSTDKVTYQVPAVTRVYPSSGPGNTATTVTLTGVQLSEASAVDFGADAATFHVNSNTSITATSPAEPPGKVAVTVTTPAGVTAVNAVTQYTYKAPTVTRISPANGSVAGGTSVTITGTLFTGTSAVTFGGVAASSFTMNSATSITAVSPAHGAGVVNVQVTATAGTTAAVTMDHFTYQTPSVTRISPTSGPVTGGTRVTITGVQLGQASAVDFGLMPATGVTVVSNTEVTAVSPPGAGTVNVTVTTPAGQTAAVAGDHFTYKT